MTLCELFTTERVLLAALGASASLAFSWFHTKPKLAAIRAERAAALDAEAARLEREAAPAPTLAELDAAVEAYREELCVESAADYLLQYGGVMREKMTPMAQRNYDADVAGHRALVDALIAAAEARGAARVRERECSWHSNPEYSLWEGECGAAWTFENGGLEENKVRYCPNCGGRVRVEDANE
jgi:hypothetical protein